MKKLITNILNHPQHISNTWLALLVFFIPISIALQNLIAFTGVFVILLLTLWKRKLQFNRWYSIILSISLFFFISEFIHDGSISRTGSLILFMLIFIQIPQYITFNHNTLKWITAGMFSGLYIGLALDQYYRPEYPLWATYGAAYANEAAFLALTTMFLSFFLNKPWKWLSIAACLYFIVMTGAKSSIIGAVCGTAVFFLIKSGYAHSIKRFLLYVVGIFIIATPIIIYFFGETIHFSVQQPRIDLAEHGLMIAKHDHWLGRGEQQFTKEEYDNIGQWMPLGNGLFHTYTQQHITPVQGIYNFPFHNLFVHAVIEHGILGLIAITLLFLIPFIMFFLHPVTTQEVAIGLGIWTSFIIHSFFELGLYNSTAVLIGLLAGLTGIFIPKKS